MGNKPTSVALGSYPSARWRSVVARGKGRDQEMTQRVIRPALVLGTILQVALFVGTCIALVASNVDAWSPRLDGLFGLATIGQLAILLAAFLAWPGRRTGFATIACLITAIGLGVRLAASAVHLETGRDPIALILSSFPPTFLGLLLVGIAMLRAEGRADRRSRVPIAMAVIGFAIGNLHQVSHRLDFTLSGFVWGVLWILFAAVTRSRSSEEPFWGVNRPPPGQRPEERMP